MTTAGQDELRTGPMIANERGLVTEITATLLERSLSTAPHVVAELLRRLGGDAGTVCEVVEQLSPSQRSGQRMLPVPLPLVRSISTRFDALEVDPQDRAALLLVALSVDGRLDVVIAAAACGADDLMTGLLGEHLTVTRGHCVFTDDRLPIWLRHTASALETARAHRRLQQAHRQRGEHTIADWHRARGSLTRMPGIAAALTATAQELNESGRSAAAFTVAMEAEGHAEGVQFEEARLVAGAAAVGAGCFEEAVELLGALFPGAHPQIRSRALASMLVAETCAHGTVPVIDPAAHRPRSADDEQWRAWARTAGLAAVMCAERGATKAMRSWLVELREADSRAGTDGDIREPAVALCWTLTGEADQVTPDAPGLFSGAIANALRSALDGDIDGGLQLLARAKADLTDDRDPLVAGFEHSPLIGAYLAVTQSLLQFWGGDIETAREALASASVELPIGAPFAGLGAVLAQRLDISVLGVPGTLPRAVAETLPGGIRVDGLVDRGISAYLGGAPEQAATDIGLWHDRGAPEPPLAVPGLDEVGPAASRSRVEPPEARDVRELLHRIRQLPDISWRREHDEIAEAGRALSSSFNRARVEALLASTCIAHGDASAGRRHLRAARSLFDDAGALAWRDATADRLARLCAQPPAEIGVTTQPMAVIPDPDPLSASRVAWEALLTGREIEVAMRIAGGAENREIATDLGLSVRTVEVYVGRLFDKLGVRNRVELAVLAHRTGLLY